MAGRGDDQQPEHNTDADEAARKAKVIADSLSATLTLVRTSLSEIRAELANARNAIDKVQKTKASRKLVVWLIISIALDIALTAGLILNSVREGQTQSSVQQVNKTECLANNIDRQKDLAVWQTLLNDLLPPGTKNVPPKDVKEVAELHYLIATKDALRNCTQLYG